MKKRILIALFVLAFACLFTFAVSAANEVTLVGGTTENLETVFKVDGNTVSGFNDGWSKDSIKDVVFPENITTIKNVSFQSSTVIETVTFASSTELVLDNVTFKESSVQKATFNPECVLNYKSGNFYNCKSLTEITFPRFAALPSNCFQLNKNMMPTNGIVFVDGITTINCHIFNGCSKVWGNVTIPASVTKINEGTFNGTAITSFDFSKCVNLTEIGGGYGGTFANITTVTSYDFSACTRLTQFRGNAMFEGCKQMTEIILPPNLTSIPHKTLAHCYKLSSIVIPASVATIADESFHSARSGQDVKTFTMYIQGNVKLNTKYVFRDSGAKIEFVLIGDGITAAQFKSTNAGIDIIQSGSHSPLDNIEVIDYLDKANPWSFVPGQARTSHIIVDNYCAPLALTGEHLSADNPCVIVCTSCGFASAKENPQHTESVSVVYVNGYANVGAKVTTCTNDGCAHMVTEEMSALFACLGYSTQENGGNSIVIGFTSDNEAIGAFEKVADVTVKYGVFAVSQNKLGNSLVFDAGGEAANGAIVADLTNSSFAMFDLKLTGFNADNMDAKLAIGAYVAVTSEDGTEYSYIQKEAPAEGESYYFASYNDILGI